MFGFVSDRKVLGEYFGPGVQGLLLGNSSTESTENKIW